MSEDPRYWSKDKIEMSVDEIFEASLEMAKWIHSEFECDTPCTQNAKDFDDKVTYLLTALPELSSKVHTLQSKLTESESLVDQLRHFIADRAGDDFKFRTMREVLEWASENVWLQRWPERSHEERWTAYPLGISKWHNAPTLYDALYEAWKSREVKS